MLLPRERQPLRSDNCRYNHSRHACSMRLRCTSCCKMDDGNRVSADAPFWWTSLPQLHTFTLSSADALWLKGVREGALPVARTPWSDAAGRRTAQLGESQNYFVTMGIQNPDNSCTVPLRRGFILRYRYRQVHEPSYRYRYRDLRCYFPRPLPESPQTDHTLASAPPAAGEEEKMGQKSWATRPYF